MNGYKADLVSRNDDQLFQIVSNAKALVDANERLNEGLDTDDAFQLNEAIAANEHRLEATISKLASFFASPRHEIE